MPFAAGSSTQPDFAAAVAECAAGVAERLGERAPDLALCFVSPAFRRDYPRLAPLLRQRLGAGCLLGCSGESLIADRREFEVGPALVVWAALLPGAAVVPFRLEFSETPDGVLCTGFPDRSQLGDQPPRAAIVCADPYSAVPQSLLERCADEFPGMPVVGGMASGAAAPGENRLFLNDEALETGAVGVLLAGGPVVRTIVSQGCRPIGTPYVVTRAERNVVFGLGGAPALQRLQELYPTLSPQDQELLEQGLHLGVAMNEYQDRFERGDFLISNVMGAHRDSGALVVANFVRAGQTVQFHVRDAASADEDLRQLLSTDRGNHPARPAAGLLFSCNGRGTRLFGTPDHDASAVQDACGPIPLAGFFANGEFGPVGAHSYIHGYTASLALFAEDA